MTDDNWVNPRIVKKGLRRQGTFGMNPLYKGIVNRGDEDWDTKDDE